MFRVSCCCECGLERVTFGESERVARCRRCLLAAVPDLEGDSLRMVEAAYRIATAQLLGLVTA